MALEVPQSVDITETDHLTKVARVLQLVLLHCPAASDYPPDVCSLLLVNPTIQAAVQQSRAYLEVDYGKHLEQDPAAILGFASWLTKHSGLVNSLRFYDLDEDHVSFAIDSVLLAMQLCAEQARQLAAGNALSPTGCPYPPPLRLKHFWTNSLVTPALLQLFPLFNLQELNLSQTYVDALTPGVCEALGKLTTLRSLECEAFVGEYDPTREQPASEAFMQAVAQLEHLTLLHLPMDSSAMPLLPVGLKRLIMPACEGPDGSRVLDLRHLTDLTHLYCAPQLGSLMTALVPPQLQDIEAYGCLQLSGALPELKEFKMRTVATGEAVPTTLALQGLQQPLFLDVLVTDIIADEDLFKMAAALGAITCLTRLAVLYELDMTEEWPLHQPWCRSLLPLTGLNSLSITMLPTLQQTDLMQLTALTGVTHLCIVNGGLNDLVAVALADSLTGLQALRLESEYVKTMAVLHPVSKLTGLKDLRLSPFCEELTATADELWRLTTLTGLTRLALALGDDCTEEVQDDFLAVMPHLTKLSSRYSGYY